MKSIKTLSLVFVAAMSTLAFTGATPAMAGPSLLCANDTLAPAPTLAECAPPTTIHYVSVGKAKALTALLNVECDVLLVIKLEDRDLVSTHPLVLRIAEEGIAYTNCNAGCTVTGTGADLLLLREAEELGKLTDVGFQIHVKCALFGVDCHYNTAKAIGHFLGPLTTGTGKAHITYTNAPLEVQLALGGCPENAKLDVLLQSLSPVYIRS